MSHQDQHDPDRFVVVEALTKAATDLGWRVSLTESHEWLVRVSVLPPLARSKSERNRWPNEPEEGEEPSQEERGREFAPDWDVNQNPPPLGITEEGRARPTGPDDIPGLLLPKSDVPPDWDVEVDTPFLGAERAD